MTTINPSPFSNIILDTLPQIDPKAASQKPADQAAFLESLATAFAASGWVAPKALVNVAQKASDALPTTPVSTKTAQEAPAKDPLNTAALALQSQLQSAASQPRSTMAYTQPDSGLAQLFKALGVG